MGDIALPSRDKLRSLASALGATLDDLLQAAGFLDNLTDVADLPDIKSYLRRKYGLHNPHLLQAIETIVTSVQSTDPGPNLTAAMEDRQEPSLITGSTGN